MVLCCGRASEQRSWPVKSWIAPREGTRQPVGRVPSHGEPVVMSLLPPFLHVVTLPDPIFWHGSCGKNRMKGGSRKRWRGPLIPHLSIMTGGAQSTNSVCVSRFTPPTLHAPTLTCYA